MLQEYEHACEKMINKSIHVERGLFTDQKH